MSSGPCSGQFTLPFIPETLILLKTYFTHQSLGLCTQSVPEVFSQVDKQPFEQAVSYDPATGTVAVRSRGATVMVVGCWVFIVLLIVAIVYMAVSMADLL